jgi:LCP family protein required for cell wall assembly
VIALAAIGVFVLVLVGVSAVFLSSVAQRFDQGTEKIVEAFPDPRERPPEPTGAAASAQNILLLGTDSRADLESIDDAAGQRSDTIMIVHIPADRLGVTVMSIMRDSWVDISGHGMAKVNAALAYGGVPLTVQTVESLIGTRIDHVAIFDFTGFIALTDAVGGVDIDNPMEFESYHLRGTTFAQGRIHLDGTHALAFARERYAFIDGDYTRVRNQQAFIAALLDKVLSSDTALNPGRVSSVLDAVTPYLKVDAGLTSGYVAGLAVELRGVHKADITFFTMPTLGTGRSEDGQSIVLLDRVKLAEVDAGFANDALDAAAFGE